MADSIEGTKRKIERNRKHFDFRPFRGYLESRKMLHKANHVISLVTTRVDVGVAVLKTDIDTSDQHHLFYYYTCEVSQS